MVNARIQAPAQGAVDPLFAFPFLLVAKLSLSDSALAMPPYAPRIDWRQGWAGGQAFLAGLDGETYARLAQDRLTYWRGVGAIPSPTVERLIKQAAAKTPA